MQPSPVIHQLSRQIAWNMLGLEMKLLLKRVGMENKNSKRARKLSRHWKNCCRANISCAPRERSKYSYSQRFGCLRLTSHSGPRGPANKKVPHTAKAMRTLLDNAISTIAKVFGSFSLTYDAPRGKTTHSTLFCATAERIRKVETPGLIIYILIAINNLDLSIICLADSDQSPFIAENFASPLLRKKQ